MTEVQLSPVPFLFGQHSFGVDTVKMPSFQTKEISQVSPVAQSPRWLNRIATDSLAIVASFLTLGELGRLDVAFSKAERQHCWGPALSCLNDSGALYHRLLKQQGLEKVLKWMSLRKIPFPLRLNMKSTSEDSMAAALVWWRRFVSAPAEAGNGDTSKALRDWGVEPRLQELLHSKNPTLQAEAAFTLYKLHG